MKKKIIAVIILTIIILLIIRFGFDDNEVPKPKENIEYSENGDINIPLRNDTVDVRINTE